LRRISSWSRFEPGSASVPSARGVLIWATLAVAIGMPLALAFTSPLLAYRSAVYAAACFAGILGLGLLLVQPLLVGGYLPGLEAWSGRRAHRWTGAMLAALVAIHVAGLGWSSPPDMIDALTFTSPTPFSPFGVVAMWAILAVAVLAAVRRRLGLRTWRIAHLSLALVIVAGSVIHGMLIEGTMETMSKAALCVLVVAAAGKVLADAVARGRRDRTY
jgi:predicted ferric reductase